MEIGQACADVLPTTHRRALSEAADVLIDTTIDNISTSDDPTWSNDNWLIGLMLPPRYKLKYDARFARRFFSCLMTVVWKLGQHEPIHLSCVAEELAAYVLIEEAEGLLDQDGVEADFGDFEDLLFEDLDFEYLYDDAYDGIEKSDRAEEMGITNLAFDDWFKRFGPPGSTSYPEVHPFAQDNIDPDAESPSKRAFRRTWNIITDDDDDDEFDANSDADSDDIG